MSRTGIRLGVVIGVVALLAGSTLLLAVRGPSALPLVCVFHKTTGLHCAGCGMTRATHAILEGRFADAFRLNPLGVILLPLALFGLVPEVIGWVRGGAPPWRVPVGRRGAVFLVALLLGFMVLRNLPWPPFTLLAPP